MQTSLKFAYNTAKAHVLSHQSSRMRMHCLINYTGSYTVRITVKDVNSPCDICICISLKKSSMEQKKLENHSCILLLFACCLISYTRSHTILNMHGHLCHWQKSALFMHSNKLISSEVLQCFSHLTHTT